MYNHNMNRLARDARACMCLDFAVYHILNKWAGMFEGKNLMFLSTNFTYLTILSIIPLNYKM